MVYRRKKYFPRKHARTVDQQIVNMQASFPSFICKRYRDTVSWIGRIRPTPLSNIYEVEVRYHIGKNPRVFVLNPKLEKPNKEKNIPHTYTDKEPCVYYPQYGEWSNDKFVADTIIPWTILWFFFYEVWLATGIWFGEGIHPIRREPYRKEENCTSS